MRWLVTGASGMLGTDVVAALTSHGQTVTRTGRTSGGEVAALDVTDARAVDDAVAGHDVVVNTAAWTAVDDAEAAEEQAARVNAEGARLLARAARRNGARLVQLSTDYVFDGTATAPYGEDVPPSPASAYGRTKAAGEQAVREELPDAHLVVRTAWLYGAHGTCFPKTIARLVHERGEVQVVADQVGQPTWTRDVAEVIIRLVELEAPPGTYHATSSGQCSWFEFAREVVRSRGLDVSVVRPTTTDAFPRPAARPAYSVLGHHALERLGLSPIGPWDERWLAAAPAVLRLPDADGGFQKS